MNIANENNQSIGLINTEPSISEFKFIIKDIANNPNVLALRDHVQHASSSRYSHCLNVAFYTYVICKKLGLDYISATKGAMLHDFYFYDWRNKNVEGQKKFHAFRHPRIALTNACDIFELNKLEKDIIVKHMWPLTIRFPKYLESYIVTFVDKYCATIEMLKYVKLKYNKIKFKNLLKNT